MTAADAAREVNRAVLALAEHLGLVWDLRGEGPSVADYEDGWYDVHRLAVFQHATTRQWGIDPDGLWTDEDGWPYETEYEALEAYAARVGR